jgi:hypothetical protein
MACPPSRRVRSLSGMFQKPHILRTCLVLFIVSLILLSTSKPGKIHHLRSEKQLSQISTFEESISNLTSQVFSIDTAYNVSRFDDTDLSIPACIYLSHCDCSHDLCNLSKFPVVNLYADPRSWLIERKSGKYRCRDSICNVQFQDFGHCDIWVTASPAPHFPKSIRSAFSALVSMESCSLYPTYCKLPINVSILISPFRQLSQFSKFTSNLPSKALFGLSSFPLKHKIKAIPVFISNCNGDSTGRLQLIEELQSFGIEVHSFGTCKRTHSVHTIAPECLKFSRLNPMDDVLKLCVIRKYRIAAAFESQNFQDYITEKIWHPLSVGVIPLYLGTTTVMDFLPHPSCCLILNKSNQIRFLVQRIHRIMQDDNYYESHVSWRRIPIQHLNPGFVKAWENSFENIFCEACDSYVLQNKR